MAEIEEEGRRRLAEAIIRTIDSRLAGLRVSMPGRVLAYDQSTQKADVQPLIRRPYVAEDGTYQTEDLPPLLDVPVEFPSSGGYGMTFPISVGDTVEVQFSDFSLEAWLTNGASQGTVDPLDSRTHNISDAICRPGLRSFAESTDQVASDANVIAGKTLIGSKDASDPVVRQSDLSGLKSYIDTHIHPDPASGFTGTPTSGSPTVTGSPELLAD